jgi:hypothetical protein
MCHKKNEEHSMELIDFTSFLMPYAEGILRLWRLHLAIIVSRWLK